MRHPLQSQLEELERLETEEERTIEEVRRRIEILDEVMSWRVPEEEAEGECPLEDGLQDVDEENSH